MRAWLKNAVEVVLWWLFERETSKMREEREAFIASLPPHPPPGKTVT